MKTKKRVIYCGCVLDPWLNVAEKLSKEGIYPVYWVGWDKKSERDIVKGKFPKVIFHGFSDAWRGIFPKETNKFKNKVLNGDLLEKLSFYELMAIRMMDRMDLDRKSFNFNQRQRLFRHFVRNWLSIIDEVKPDIIISPSIPHRVFDYVLYAIAKEKNIPFLTYKNTYLKGLIIPIRDVDNLSDGVGDYNKHNNLKVSKETKRALDKIRGSYEDAEPDYMKSKKKDGDFYKLNSIAKDFFRRPKQYVNFFINIFNSNKSYYKNKSKNIEESDLSFLQVEFKKWRGRVYKNRLKKYYNNLTVKPNLRKKYLLVALHYQPEATSAPSASIFTDQFLMIDMLSKTIPKDWKIYVKEHSAQFYSLGEGETSREKFFYDDIKKLKSVDLISTDFDTFKLIDNSVAVVTLTGTIGFESVVRGKPVLVFGNAWYSPLESVFKIKNKEDLNKAIDKIKSGIKNNRKDLLKYLYYLENKIGIYAYHYKNTKERSGLSKDKSVDSLIKSVKWCLKQK